MASSSARADAAAGGSRVSEETVSRSVAAKMYIEQHYEKLMADMKERKDRRAKLEQTMESSHLGSKEKTELRKQLGEKESSYMRLKRQRMSERHFEKLRVIGRGAFGEVWIVKKKDSGEVLAMKKLKKEEMLKKDQIAHVRAERDILVLGNQTPWVVKLHYSFQDPKYLYLIMDYLAGGDMMTMLIKYDTFPEDWARFYVAETILAISSVHTFGYIHRDVKPDNLLLDREGHLKLTDFGLATGFHPMHSSSFYEEIVAKAKSFKLKSVLGPANDELRQKRTAIKKRQLAYSTVGTPDYTAPEVFLQLGYGKECDMWSIGAIMFEMLIGYPPFISDTSTETCLKIINWQETLKFPDQPIISPEARDLISRLICDRSTRLCSAEDVMQHPWFAGVVWDNFRQRYRAPVVPALASPTDTSNFDHYDPLPSESGALGAAPSAGGSVATAEEVLSDEEANAYEDEPPSYSESGVAPPSSATSSAARPGVAELPFIGYTYRGGFDGVLLDPKGGGHSSQQSGGKASHKTLGEIFGTPTSSGTPPALPPSPSNFHKQ